MLASYQWLKELSCVEASPEEVAEKLTSAGLEVEALDHRARNIEGVVVGEVRAKRKHPERDKLSIVTVFDGESEQEVVCGAPNVPEPGGRVLFARFGAKLPGGFEIGERKLGGVLSRGMICSESELEIGEGAEGIFVFEPEEWSPLPEPGADIVEAMALADTIFEVGLTPNRPDCLGHFGLARDLAVLFGRKFTPPLPRAPEHLASASPAPVAEGASRFELSSTWEGSAAEAREFDAAGLGPVSVEIRDADRCPRYGAALVLGVTVGPSPFWLRYRLHCLGLRSVSNLVDATNLVMLETGHPIHGFDLERVRGRRIVVRLADEGEALTTLDGEERTLTADDLLICDGEGPVAIAGVMGGASSEITEATRNVLIECAYFDPRSVRRSSRRTGLHTDASHRFERGVDPDDIGAVLGRISTLMAELGCGAVVPQGLDEVARTIERREVSLRDASVESLLGVAVPRATSRGILEGLGCRLLEESEDAMRFELPSGRPDLGREVDLIEEVIRIHGYDKIPTRIPRVRASESGTPERVRFEMRLREAASATGLYEAINYSFVSPADLARVRVSTDAISLQNPLSEERSVMRTSLLPGLAEVAARAQRHGATGVGLYELGRSFHPADAPLPEERSWLAIFLLGSRQGWIGDPRAVDFFDAKGQVEALLHDLTGLEAALVEADSLDERAPYLHPRRRAAILLGGRRVGHLGELHPDIGDALGIEGRGVYAELEVIELAAVALEAGLPQAKALPKFPAVTRDLAMVLRDEFTAGEVAEALLEEGGELAESVRLFDLYRGSQVPDGHRSLAFRVVYRSPEGTLTDKKVDKVHGRLTKSAIRRFDAAIR